MLLNALRYLILPAVAVGTIPMSIIARMTRSSVLETLGQDYVRSARAKGLRELIVVLRHAVARAVDAGARLAEPGEFTLRAYLNGRIDLPQAEAVRDLIDATTLYQARIAAQQVDAVPRLGCRRRDRHQACDPHAVRADGDPGLADLPRDDLRHPCRAPPFLQRNPQKAPPGVQTG